MLAIREADESKEVAMDAVVCPAAPVDLVAKVEDRAGYPCPWSAREELGRPRDHVPREANGVHV